MQYFSLLLLHLRSALVRLVIGKSESLSEIVKLEEGFFHDLKGLFNKRLGLPINKFESGDHSDKIEQDIQQGATDVVKRFREVRPQFFDLIAPDWELVKLYRAVQLLEKSLVHSDSASTIQLLRQVQDRTSSFYTSRITKSLFDLHALISQVVADHKATEAGTSSAVQLKLTVSDDRITFRLPYVDYSTWRRIFDNVIINAIEAVEMTDESGKVSVTLSYGKDNKAKVIITDTGVGMNEETLASFSTRGFTSGKLHGQGLGINEDVIAFVNKRGRFGVQSKSGAGTTIEIEIDAEKISGADAESHRLPLRWTRGFKIAGRISIIVVATYLLLLIPFESLRWFWKFLATPIENAYLTSPDPTSPTTYSGLATFDKHGGRIWEISLSPYFVNHNGVGQTCQPLVDDFNSDGRKEVVYAATGSYAEDSNWTGYIACVGDFKRQMWRWPLGPESTPAPFGLPKIDESEFNPRSIEIVKRPGQEPEILIVATSRGYQCQVQLRSGTGSCQAEYWHIGHLSLFDRPRDFDQDGKVEIVLSGQNNRLGNSPVIVLLEIDSLHGQSPPYLDPFLEHGREKAYYVFGHPSYTGMKQYAPAYQGAYKRLIGTLDVRQYFDFAYDDGQTFRFDATMTLDSIIVDEGLFRKWWNELRSIGKIDRDCTQDDIDALRGYRKYVRGELVEDRIFVHPEMYGPEF